MQAFTTEEKLQERIKELTCLYNVSNALLHEESVEKTLEIISHILKDAWLFQEDAIVEMQLENITVTTSALPRNSVSQEVAIYAFNETKGLIRVHYDADKHSSRDFLDDEAKLLSVVGFEVSGYYEKLILKRSAQRTDRLSILGEITAGIAHELNTPLGNILGFAELIKGRSTDPQTIQDSSKVIKAAIYSREIVKKLMFFSCEMPQHKNVIEIIPVVTEALRMLEPNFKKAGVLYSISVQDPAITARLDSIQLTQVIFNILMNSIYFAPKGSTINIDITSDATAFTLTIADTGPGISNANKTKIFEPFFTTKPFGDGTGLGLSVVHGIIKSHRGTIRVLDNIPKGTIFEIQLPTQ